MQNPNQELILNNFKYLMSFPPVSIVVPVYKYDTTPLRESLENDGYFGEKEILIEEDVEVVGCPKMVNRLVNKARHDFVVYLGQDCVVDRYWLNHAIIVHRSSHKDDVGLTALNDGIYLKDWSLKLACHFLFHKKLLPFLEDGQIFNESFSHYAVDDYLTLQCMIHNKLAYSHKATIKHSSENSESKERGNITRERDREIYEIKKKALIKKYGYTP